MNRCSSQVGLFRVVLYSSCALALIKLSRVSHRQGPTGCTPLFCGVVEGKSLRRLVLALLDVFVAGRWRVESSGMYSSSWYSQCKRVAIARISLDRLNKTRPTFSCHRRSIRLLFALIFPTFLWGGVSSMRMPLLFVPQRMVYVVRSSSCAN